MSKRIDAATQKSIIDYNVFQGQKVTGMPRYTISRGDVVWGEEGSNQPRPGRGNFVKRPTYPAVNRALSKWKELTAPRKVERSAEHMPIGV